MSNQKRAVRIFAAFGSFCLVLLLGYLLLKQLRPDFFIQILPRVTERDFEFIGDEALKKHFVAQANQINYRIKTHSDAANLTFITEVQIRDEAFNTREIEQDNKGNETKQEIQIADTLYIKDLKDSKWWKETIKLENISKEEKPLDFKDEYSRVGLEFKFLGKEPCTSSSDEMTCFKYEQLTGGPEGMDYKRIFWFDDRKYLLRKDETTVGEFTNKIEYSYNDIAIIPPYPLKNTSSETNLIEYLFGGSENSNQTQSTPTPAAEPTPTPDVPNITPAPTDYYSLPPELDEF